MRGPAWHCDVWSGSGLFDDNRRDDLESGKSVDLFLEDGAAHEDFVACHRGADVDEKPAVFDFHTRRVRGDHGSYQQRPAVGYLRLGDLPGDRRRGFEQFVQCLSYTYGFFASHGRFVCRRGIPASAGRGDAGLSVCLSVCLSVIVLAGDDFFIRADARFPAAILRVL